MVTGGTALTHRYAPRGACKELFSRREDEVLLSGPAGTGKSRAALEKLLAAALKYPGMKGLIVRQVRSSLGATALDTWRRDVAFEALAARLVRFYGGSDEKPPEYQFTNGSRILIGGMDDPIKIMSSEYDMIYVQEATELRIEGWEALTTRLRNGRMPYQQLIADCNPDSPYHWLYARCQRGQTVMLYSRHEDNPRLFGENGELTEYGKDYMARLDALTGVRLQRLRYGRWVAAEGLVYEDYDPALSLIDPFEIPASWARWWSIDFGFTNPFVCQWWAEDPDGRLYLYRELYHTKRTTDVHAYQILAVNKGEPRPQGILCDHDAEGRAVLERELQLPTIPANKAVTTGIEAVQVRFKPAKDGKPRLFLCRNAVIERDPDLESVRKPCSTVEEIVSYAWATGPRGELIKEEPVKKDDHGMDAMRYIVAHRDLTARPRARWFDPYGHRSSGF